MPFALQLRGPFGADVRAELSPDTARWTVVSTRTRPLHSFSTAKYIIIRVIRPFVIFVLYIFGVKYSIFNHTRPSLSNNTPPKKKLTPLQIIITVAILVVAVFQILTREGDTSEQQHTAETAAAALLENAGGASDQEAGELSTEKPSAGSDKPAQATSTRAPANAQKTADFDFYVLALSWSPDYCATDGQKTELCAARAVAPI